MAFAKLHHRQNSKNERIYYVEYRLPGRKNSKFTIGNVEARKAKEIADNIRALIIQGINPHEFVKEQAKYSKDKPRLKLSELIEAYMKYCSIGQRPKTIQIKKDAFKKFLNHCGNQYIDFISAEEIELWMASLKPSKTTINKKLQAIRAMFNWGFNRNMFKTNPFTNSGIKQYSVSDTNPEDYFTLKEVRLILKALKETNEMLWRLVLLALETGGRLSELVALTGNDIDLQNARALFRGPTTKSGRNRYVPLRPETVEEINEWHVYSDGRLFRWVDFSKPSKLFTKILVKLKPKNTSTGKCTFHTLRHTYASHLLMNGVNIFIVSRWLGHSSVKVIESHYGHLIPEMLKVSLPY